MNILARFSFAVLAGALLYAGCAQSPQTVRTNAPGTTKPEGARLSPAEVIRIAKQTAERRGIDLREYEIPAARYNFTGKDWFVFFDGLVPLVGNHFSVTVDDRTCEARFSGGR